MFWFIFVITFMLVFHIVLHNNNSKLTRHIARFHCVTFCCIFLVQQYYFFLYLRPMT